MGNIYTIQDLVRARAIGAAAVFEGRNMVLRQGGRVHAVASVEWLDGVQGPAPACHVGSARGPMVDAVPTEAAVNCRTCIRRRAHVPHPAGKPRPTSGRARPKRTAPFRPRRARASYVRAPYPVAQPALPGLAE